MSSFIPNAFMLPNDLIDKGYLAKMKGAALPCYLLIVRKTRGWNKTTDSISLSQFVKATGYNKDTVQKGLIILEEMGVIVKLESDRQINEWSITDQISTLESQNNSENLVSNHTKISPTHTEISPSENLAMLKNSIEPYENLVSNHTKISPHNNNIKTKKTRESITAEKPESEIQDSEENSVEHTLKIWTPNLDDLNSWLQRSGLPKITQTQVDEILLEINPHYENKIHTGTVSSTQMYSNFVKWVKRDSKLTGKLFEQSATNQQTQQSEPQPPVFKGVAKKYKGVNV